MSLCSSFSCPLFLLFFFIIILSNPLRSSAQNQSSSFSFSDFPWRPDQNRILVSSNSVFAAGFHRLQDPPNTYTFSIWYRNISQPRTIVWSTSQTSPVNASTPLVITRSGELRLNGSTGQNLFPSMRPPLRNSTDLVLSNDGNLVYGGWESFLYPTNTILPNQNINGTVLSSANGKYRFVNTTKIMFGTEISYWTAYDGNAFLKLDDQGKLAQANGDSFIAADFGASSLRRLTLDDDGNMRIYSFNSNSSSTGWTVVWQAVYELCTVPGSCDRNAICMNDDASTNTYCVCPPGFRWANESTGGKESPCERKIPISNPGNTKFISLEYVNFSGGSNQTVNIDARNFTNCQAECLRDRNCLGFGFKYDGSRHCVQLRSLMNGYWSPGTEMATFLRVDGSETDRTNFTGMTSLLETTCPVQVSLPLPPDESNSTTRNIVIICTLFAAELISGVVFFWAFLRKYVKYRDMARTFGLEFLPAGGPKRFSYAELKAATDNFSNHIGRGGFGDVYKGELTDHRVVAVKVLKDVTSGDHEFWAEVSIIARMHHLNLVRLWGFCVEKGQRILVYEYVPNGSLDKFLFQLGRVQSSEGTEDSINGGPELQQKPLLDWNIRYRIALGVARAVAYLHEECLEWVLHRDIKPENILIGDDFCPKISDFGLAKLKNKEDMVSIQSRIQGTRGYMAPEWAKSDTITPKADVYSFGMVLLELVTGVRNCEIQGSKMASEDWYFPRWAFDKVYKEMNVEDILDRRIQQSYDSRAHFDMVDRMVKTAMWCLQDRPEMRPSMGKVAKMLEGTVEIMEPKKPTIFFLGED